MRVLCTSSHCRHGVSSPTVREGSPHTRGYVSEPSLTVGLLTRVWSSQDAHSSGGVAGTTMLFQHDALWSPCQ